MPGFAGRDGLLQWSVSRHTRGNVGRPPFGPIVTRLSETRRLRSEFFRSFSRPGGSEASIFDAGRLRSEPF